MFPVSVPQSIGHAFCRTYSSRCTASLCDPEGRFSALGLKPCPRLSSRPLLTLCRHVGFCAFASRQAANPCLMQGLLLKGGVGSRGRLPGTFLKTSLKACVFQCQDIPGSFGCKLKAPSNPLKSQGASNHGKENTAVNVYGEALVYRGALMMWGCYSTAAVALLWWHSSPQKFLIVTQISLKCY